MHARLFSTRQVRTAFIADKEPEVRKCRKNDHFGSVLYVGNKGQFVLDTRLFCGREGYLKDRVHAVDFREVAPRLLFTTTRH